MGSVLAILIVSATVGAPGAPDSAPSPIDVSAVSGQLSIDDERYLLAEARRLVDGGAAREALDLLDAYATQFSADGALRYEALRLDVEVMMLLGLHSPLLQELERARLRAPDHADLLVTRGELLASARRSRAAIDDFDEVLSTKTASRDLKERALAGRAFALLQAGQVHAARAELQRYLDAFPAGRFALLAQRSLTPRRPLTQPRLPDPLPSIE